MGLGRLSVRFTKFHNYFAIIKQIEAFFLINLRSVLERCFGVIRTLVIDSYLEFKFQNQTNMRNKKMRGNSSLALVSSTLASVTIASSLFVLSGCNSSDDKVNIDYSNLQKSSVQDSPLTGVSGGDFSTYIKNGIRLRLSGQNDSIALASVSEGDQLGIGTSSFSTTNVHEIGVDEADRMKYDGNYLYQVNQDYFETTEGNRNNNIRVFSSDPENATLQLVSEIENESEELRVSDLFLRADAQQLVTINKTEFYAWDSMLIDLDWRWTSGKTQVQLYDVQTPENPSEQWKIEIEGNLEGSRRIDNILYLVTRYIPNIEEIDYAASSDDEKIANERLIANTPVSDLLPHYQTNDGAIRSLVDADDCLVNEGNDDNDGYADIITLSAIDLDTQQVTSSVCLNTNIQGIYSSTSGFYIGGSSNFSWFGFAGFTSVHKFDLDGSNIEYKASKSLPGTLGWNNASFRMSEFNDQLRIVTTDFNQSNNDPEHHLTVLAEDGSNELEVISSLPNDINPEPIGKVGEDIFAVRFTDSRAYIVTFERVDPLYVIDLSTPESPVIAGALEIPGFSRYLHPLSEDWLLGIGNEAENGLIQGVKVELYDIRDMSNPLVKDKLVFGDRGSYSEATYDLRSISLLNVSEQQQRLAIPIDIWQQLSQPSSSQWLESGLFLFEIDTAENDERSLTLSGKMITESFSGEQSHPSSQVGGRSQLHDDAVFYLHGNRFYGSLWGDWGTQNGPY